MHATLQPGVQHTKTTKAAREMDASRVDACELKAEMDAHGYMIIRNVLPAEDTRSLLGEITEVLRSAGWLSPGDDPIDRTAKMDFACADGDPTYKEVYGKVFRLRSFHALSHHPRLRRIMEALTGPELLIHPKSEARLIFPNFDPGIIHAHQDHTAVGGDSECFTAWLPLHDCPLEHGPLRVLEGSHRFGLQPTVQETGYIPPGSEQGAQWVSSYMNAGDLLLFHSLTIHEAMPNLSNKLRISMDFRFQSYTREVNPEAFVFAGSGRRSWEKTYEGWPADELKYYWTRMPIKFKPSRSELLELSQSCELPGRRERYARILERLESAMPVPAR
jgi:ectoine hydroxylase-related dioxygenase (phytanoyl-CoA dioxygenase family)